MTVKCCICKKEFKTVISQIKMGRGRFCSNMCRGEWQSRNKAGEDSSSWRGGVAFTKTLCQTCGKEFSAQTSELKKGSRKFCSRKCYGAAKKYSSMGEGNINWRGGKVEQRCPICGCEFRFKSKNTKRTTCSRRCMGIWRSKTFVGIKSPTWKGGITPVIARVRSSSRYDSWRIKVFQRDSFTCKKCGKKGGDLEAHHIKPFAALMKDIHNSFPLFDLYSGAMAFLPLWDISNGTTLCVKCHDTDHSKGGIIRG